MIQMRERGRKNDRWERTETNDCTNEIVSLLLVFFRFSLFFFSIINTKTDDYTHLINWNMTNFISLPHTDTNRIELDKDNNFMTYFNVCLINWANFVVNSYTFIVSSSSSFNVHEFLDWHFSSKHGMMEWINSIDSFKS